ncbi:redox-regulated ATPase YchF [Metallosphaera tengchongensis]|uniref:Redox-regulated ATPase YchF n=1 Tax=Metallosphaera tengchongensis TaxID=1532350 RepID=A0A6N0NYX5_9CREN|nr:redox-regulated ATPase YchF [Metallosphaera tengchongensis]QKR01023.1 redox-regulated ATPase YchF [Metallosphaera tengchongensis]
MITVGLIGKTNVGKSTFFASATMLDVEIANRPFVTIEPNVGIAYAKKKCVHTELKVVCNPKNSICVEDYRFIPIKLVDVAGLIPGAHEGRGLGNKFLDDLRKADVLIHVIDASGSTNEEGVAIQPGSRDPEADIEFVTKEIDEWFFSILKKDWEKFARTTDLSGKDIIESLLTKVSGLSVNRKHLIKALKASGLENVKLLQWGEEGLRKFSSKLREVSKPIIIAANKADVTIARENIKRLQSKYPFVVPVSAESELALRKAAKAGIIKYIPGDGNFKLTGNLDERKAKALEYIKTNVLEIYGNTGVQQAINEAVFGALNLISVYPVEDEKKFTNKDGDVLPDVLLLEMGSTAKDLAYSIHTDLGKGFLYAVDARRKTRLGEDYVLQDGDVIKIVSSLARA